MTKQMAAVAAIAIAAVAAAGVGSYLGVRHAIGPGPQSAPTTPAELAIASAEPSPAAEAPPETAGATTGTLVEVEPAEAAPAAAPREPRRRESPTRASRREASARPASAGAVPTTRDRASAPVERAVEPRPRPQPAAAPAPPARPEPRPEPAPAPAAETNPSADSRPAAAEPRPPAGDLPVVEGWVRADAPAGAGAARPVRSPSPAPPPGAPSRAEPQRRPLPSTSLIDARAARPPIGPDPWPAFDELEIAADSVIGIQIDTAVSTRTARLEDPVEARVIRDVQVGPRVAIPSGTRIRGSVVVVETGGRLRSASRLGVRFHTLLMDDGAEVTLSTETVYREGESPGGDSVAKIGGAAVAGSILGAIFGGERGAAIGGSIGAAGGTAAALNGEAEPAALPPGSRLTVRLTRPASVMAPR